MRRLADTGPGGVVGVAAARFYGGGGDSWSALPRPTWPCSVRPQTRNVRRRSGGRLPPAHVVGMDTIQGPSSGHSPGRLLRELRLVRPRDLYTALPAFRCCRPEPSWPEAGLSPAGRIATLNPVVGPTVWRPGPHSLLGSPVGLVVLRIMSARSSCLLLSGRPVITGITQPRFFRLLTAMPGLPLWPAYRDDPGGALSGAGWPTPLPS